MVWTMRTRVALVLLALGAWLPARALAEITRYEIEVPASPAPSVFADSRKGSDGCPGYGMSRSISKAASPVSR
jgi:hypothetical protein